MAHPVTKHALLLLIASPLACRNPSHNAHLLSGASTVAEVAPAVEATRETVDFASCQSTTVPTEDDEEHGRDTDIECAMADGLIAQQSSSACFNINRLLDAERTALFESDLDTSDETVFVVDSKFAVYQCENRPVALVQSGGYFAQGPSPENPCHGANAVRRAYSVQDIRNKKRYDGLSSTDATARLRQIIHGSSCDLKPITLP